MGLHLPNIPTILTPIPDTSRGQHWLGERPSPWVAYGPNNNWGNCDWDDGNVTINNNNNFNKNYNKNVNKT